MMHELNLTNIVSYASKGNRCRLNTIVIYAYTFYN
jgi:hypothetical protein